MHPNDIRKILWIALLFSTFIYLGVLQVATVPSGEGLDATMPIAFAVTALGTAVVSFVVPSMLAGQGLQRLSIPTTPAPNFGELAGGTLIFIDSAGARSTARQVLFTPFILRLAMREAVAIYGVVLGFMGYPLAVYIGFFVAAWVLFLLAFPSQKADDVAIERAYNAKLT